MMTYIITGEDLLILLTHVLVAVSPLWEKLKWLGRKDGNRRKGS